MIFVVLFVLLFAVACWGIIYARGKWPLKLAAIVAIPLIALAMHTALDTYRGFPAKTEPPKEAQFVSCLVIEPDRIYLWLIPLHTNGGPLDYKPDSSEPRAYSLPYTRNLHEQCAKAQEAQKQGGPGTVGLRRGKEGRGTPGGKYHAFLLPRPHFPEKGAPR
jgi:hypothetical protein